MRVQQLNPATRRKRYERSISMSAYFGPARSSRKLAYCAFKPCCMPATTVHTRNLIAGMVMSAASTFVVARSGTTPTAVAGISIALFCIHFAGTSGWGYAQAVSPARYVASLCALQNFASFMIASAAPVLTGWLLDRTQSFSIALGVCSAVTLLGAVSYGTLAAPSGNFAVSV